MSSATSSTDSLAPAASVAPFVRDSTTWLSYFACFYLLSIQASLGPAMPYVRSERGLSYAVAGLHFTAVAVGALIMGLLASRVVRKAGRRPAFWAGIGGITLGGLLFISIGAAPLSILGALIIGMSGCLVVIVVQANLAEQFPVHRSVALVEINLACSAGTIVAAFGVGLASQTPMGWQFAFIAPMLACVVMAIVMRAAPFAPGMPAEARHRRGMKLPTLFWVLCATAALSAAGEWCISYWGADFLYEAADTSKGTAAAMLSLFFIGVTLGRLAGRNLVRKVMPSHLLIGSFLVAMSGFPFFWLAPWSAVRLAGLFIVGLGISNVYPAVSSIAAHLLPRHLDVAFSHLQVTGNMMILAAPLALGLLGDHYGIATAMAMLIPFFCGALGLSFWINRQPLEPTVESTHL